MTTNNKLFYSKPTSTSNPGQIDLRNHFAAPKPEGSPRSQSNSPDKNAISQQTFDDLNKDTVFQKLKKDLGEVNSEEEKGELNSDGDSNSGSDDNAVVWDWNKLSKNRCYKIFLILVFILLYITKNLMLSNKIIVFL